MDIYERLTADHQTQRELVTKLADTSGDSEGRRELWSKFWLEAEAHANAEEQVFYEVLIGANATQKQARHSVAEHKHASDLIAELKKTDMSSPGWLTTFEKLKDALLHHVDEEEKEVFAMARGVISSPAAEDMADEFDKRKQRELEELRKS